MTGNPSRLLCPKAASNAQVRMFCFPYAGGGASVFNSWPELLPPQVELWSVQLPGRETQRAEPPFTRIEPAAAGLADLIRPWLDLPFVFYGHSMGALLCFELARLLRRRGLPLPKCLFVSGCRAPHLSATRTHLHQLPDGEFLGRLRSIGGTPEDVLGNSELMELFVPLLRADFELCETYIYSEETPLESRISCFGGLDDPRVTPEDLSAWRSHGAAPFQVRFFPGAHFFIHTARTLLLTALRQDLKEILRWLSRRMYTNQ